MALRPLPNVVWNLYLAAIPVVLALILFKGIRKERRLGKVHWLLWTPLLLIWFFYLPNTCYLITEWRHYLADLTSTRAHLVDARHTAVNLYFFLGMTTFYCLYTGSGLICFYLSIYPIDLLFKPKWPVRAVVFYLCALGVYLGLLDRFNSWDILFHEPAVFYALRPALCNPALELLMFTFGGLLWIFYGLFGLTLDGVLLRFPTIRPILE